MRLAASLRTCGRRRSDNGLPHSLSSQQESTAKQESRKQLKAKADEGKRLQQGHVRPSTAGLTALHSSLDVALQELDKVEKELQKLHGKKPQLRLSCVGMRMLPVGRSFETECGQLHPRHEGC